MSEETNKEKNLFNGAALACCKDCRFMFEQKGSYMLMQVVPALPADRPIAGTLAEGVVKITVARCRLRTDYSALAKHTLPNFLGWSEHPLCWNVAEKGETCGYRSDNLRARVRKAFARIKAVL